MEEAPISARAPLRLPPPIAALASIFVLTLLALPAPAAPVRPPPDDGAAVEADDLAPIDEDAPAAEDGADDESLAPDGEFDEGEASLADDADAVDRGDDAEVDDGDERSDALADDHADDPAADEPAADRIEEAPALAADPIHPARVCARLFGDRADRRWHRELRTAEMVSVESRGRIVEITHGTRWHRPFYLELAGVELVATELDGPGEWSAVLDVEGEAIDDVDCPSGLYRIGRDAALGKQARVIAVLDGALLVEFEGNLAYLLTPEAEAPTWQMVWRSGWYFVRKSEVESFTGNNRSRVRRATNRNRSRARARRNTRRTRR